jgi:hypothetical protein
MTKFPTRIKVLQLEFWMKISDDNFDDRTPDDNSFIGPAIIGKDAWYYDGTGVSWFEYKGNSYATKGLAESFKYALELFDTALLTNEQEKSLRAMAYSLPKSQSSLIKTIQTTLQKNYRAKSLREVGRRSQLDLLLFRKKQKMKKNKLTN